MNVFLIGVVISMIVYLVVGNYVGRSVKNAEDYYVAGRNAPTVLIVGSLIASFLSTGAFLGDTGEVASGVFMAIVIVGVMQGCGYIYGANFFGRYIRRSETLTLPEFYGTRFNSKRMRKLAGITCIIAVCAYMLSATRGITSLMSNITGLPEWGCILIAWASYTFFTIFAGSPGVLVTDTMMFFVFLVAAIIAIPCITINAGGWTTAITNLATSTELPGLLSWSGYADYVASSGQTTMWAIVYGIVWMLVVMVSPWQTSRYMMAKNEHVVLRSAIWASMGVITVTMLLYFSAAFVASVSPGLGSDTMIWAAMNMMPTLVGVILLTGVLAAGISSGSTFLSLIGFSLTNDLLDPQKVDEKKRLSISRWGMIVASLLVLVMAFFADQIFWIMYFGGTVIAGGWGVVSFASIWSKKLTERGAFYSMLLGFTGCFVARLYTDVFGGSLPFFLDSFFIGIYLSIIGMFLGNMGQTPTEEEIRQREKLFIVPEAEKDPAMMRRTYNTYKVHIVFSIFITCLFIFGYALPYGSAIAAAGL